MAKSFVQFLKQKITISVLITVVVFNIFNPVADDIFGPLIGYIIDPSGHLDNSKIKLNEIYEVKYGTSIKQFIVAIIVLGLIYYVDRFFSSSIK
jgi:large-conductance mechanosensitive channel